MGVFRKHILKVLIIIRIMQNINNLSQMSFIKICFLFWNEINTEINKNNAPIGRAEGRKKTPSRNNWFPNPIFSYDFTNLVNIVFIL